MCNTIQGSRPMGYSRKKIHTPTTEGLLEVLTGGGGGLTALEIQTEGGL